jgi:hypothetical protein
MATVRVAILLVGGGGWIAQHFLVLRPFGASAARCPAALPARLVEPAPRLHFPDYNSKTKGPREAALLFCLVEAAGIEPASASPTSMVLHA